MIAFGTAVKAAVLALCCAMAVPALAQQQAPRPAQPAPKADPAVLPPPTVERVNAYFNALKGLEAKFTQLSPDGRSFGGTLYLLRPGLMRFEYNPPATLEIIADGKAVAIRDRKLRTQDEYFIGQTPLKFLLQPNIDVAKDSTVRGIKRDGDAIVLDLEDRSTLGGTSKIRVKFDGRSHALKEWTVIDPQGQETRVMLSELNPNASPDRKLFVIDRQRIINPN